MGIFDKIFVNKKEKISRNEIRKLLENYDMEPIIINFGGQTYVKKENKKYFEDSIYNRVNGITCKDKVIDGISIKVKILDIMSMWEIPKDIDTKIHQHFQMGYEYIVLDKVLYNSILLKSNEIENAYQLLKYSIDKTAELNCKGIELEKEGDIDAAIEVYEENIKLGCNATHSYDRLGVIYRKRNDVENEKRVLCRRYEVYKLDKYSLAKELKRIDDKQNGVKAKYLLPKEPIIIPTKKHNTLGFDYETLKKKLPEFNYYYDKPDDMSTSDYLWSHKNLINDYEYKPLLWDIKNKFSKMAEEAKEYERGHDLASASVIYENMINEEYYMPTPYDRLIKIYSKAKLYEHEKRVLELSIPFFTKLRESQREYVIYLAKKVDKLTFCLQRINDNEKIFYHGGSHELYNPFLIIAKWEKRLSKIYNIYGH